MAVVNNYENVVARSSSGEIRNSPTYKRTFTVRCDNPDTSMVAIANAPGITYGAPHPHDASCFVTNVDVDADGDSMLIYTVSYTYTRPVNDLSVTGGTPSDPSGGSVNKETPPDPLQIPEGYWTGSSTLETRQSPVTTTGEQIRMTNGRPYTSGIPTDFAAEQIVMTNSYASWDDVAKIGRCVDKMNSTTWPVGTEETTYGPLAWKIMSFNWSFKQQTSEQQRLEYYDVSVTLQRVTLNAFDSDHMKLIGWPDALVNKDANGKVTGPKGNRFPAHLPQISNTGFREKYYKPDAVGQPVLAGLRDITTDIVYYNCDGEEIDPPNDPDEDENSPCVKFPRKEPTTEEMPLDLLGRAVPPDTKGSIIIPWMEDITPIDFTELFGNGPPYAPKKGPL